MMTRFSVAALAALSLFALGGCSLFGSKSDESGVKLRQSLEVPPDLARPAGDDLSAVPAASASDYAAKAGANGAPAASGTAVANGAPKVAATPARVQLQREGALRWLVVQSEPAQVWAAVRDYFVRNNMKLVVEDAKNGLLETDWMDRPVQTSGGFFSDLFGKLRSTGLRDKYRVRVEPGRAAGTSELYVSHLGQEEVITGGGGIQAIETAWQMRPADPMMEAGLLDKLMPVLGAGSQQEKNQLAAASAPQAQLAKGALLLPQDDMDSAWRHVAQALDRYGIVVEDRDRSAGIFYIRYHDKNSQGKSGGLFSWLSSDTKSGTETASEASRDRFQVCLKATATGTSVSVLDVKGEPPESKAGEHLLEILYRQLR